MPVQPGQAGLAGEAVEGELGDAAVEPEQGVEPGHGHHGAGRRGVGAEGVGRDVAERVVEGVRAAAVTRVVRQHLCERVVHVRGRGPAVAVDPVNQLVQIVQVSAGTVEIVLRSMT